MGVLPLSYKVLRFYTEGYVWYILDIICYHSPGTLDLPTNKTDTTI